MNVSGLEFRSDLVWFSYPNVGTKQGLPFVVTMLEYC